MKNQSSVRSWESPESSRHGTLVTGQSTERRPNLNWALLPISALVLLICLFYTYSYAFRAPPYTGITLSDEWIVTGIEFCTAYPQWCEANREGFQELRIGDELLSVGDLTYDDYLEP